MNAILKNGLMVVLWFLATAGSLSGEEYALVKTSAAAAIQANNLEAGRSAALAEAKARCVREVLRADLLGAEEFARHSAKLQETFLDHPAPYLARFDVENEEIIDEGQRYRVSVAARVRKAALSVALIENGIGDVLAVAPKPTVMVLVRERFETRASGTRMAELTLAKALQQHGFKVVDPEQKKLIDLRNRLFAEGTGEMRAALQSAMSFQADYLIFGEAAVSSSEPLSGTDLKARLANVSLKLVEASSGNIITTETAQGSRKHVDELTGGNWALEDAAGLAATNLLVQFQRILKDEMTAGADVLLDLYGLDYDSQAGEAEAVLRKATGVRSVVRRMFMPGLAQFEVKFTGPATDLAQALKKSEIDGQAVEIIETLPRYLRVQRLGGQKKVEGSILDLQKRFLEEKYKQFDLEKAREQDKELIAKITELAASKKISDAQRKQLETARKEVEERRQELAVRQRELEQRQEALRKAEAEKRELEKRAQSLEQQAAAAQNTQQQMRQEVQRVNQHAYVASQNCANARASCETTALDYVNSIQQGVQLGRQLGGLLGGGLF